MTEEGRNRVVYAHVCVCVCVCVCGVNERMCMHLFLAMGKVFISMLA